MGNVVLVESLSTASIQQADCTARSRDVHWLPKPVQDKNISSKHVTLEYRSMNLPKYFQA
jgi:hypothetical protein